MNDLSLGTMVINDWLVRAMVIIDWVWEIVPVSDLSLGTEVMSKFVV